MPVLNKNQQKNSNNSWAKIKSNNLCLLLFMLPGERDGIPVVIRINGPLSHFRHPTPPPDAYLFFREIQGHDMIGIDIICPFFAVDTAGPHQNIRAAGIGTYFFYIQPVYMAV